MMAHNTEVCLGIFEMWNVAFSSPEPFAHDRWMSVIRGASYVVNNCFKCHLLLNY